MLDFNDATEKDLLICNQCNKVSLPIVLIHFTTVTLYNCLHFWELTLSLQGCYGGLLALFHQITGETCIEARILTLNFNCSSALRVLLPIDPLKSVFPPHLRKHTLTCTIWHWDEKNPQHQQARLESSVIVGNSRRLCPLFYSSFQVQNISRQTRLSNVVIIVGSGDRAVERRTVNRGDGGSTPPTTVLRRRQFCSPHICLCLSEETLKASGPSIWCLYQGK